MQKTLFFVYRDFFVVIIWVMMIIGRQSVKKRLSPLVEFQFEQMRPTGNCEIEIKWVGFQWYFFVECILKDLG